MNRTLLPLAAALVCVISASAADTPPVLPPGCLGSVLLGRVKLSVSAPWKGGPLPISDVSTVPPGARLMWEPVHLSQHMEQRGEVAALVISQTHGDLIVMPASRANTHAEWDLPRGASVVALVFGPDGLNMNKVKKLITADDELLPELAAYAQQTSQVEALVQTLADSEQQGGGTEAALKGFASAYGVAVPKLDPAESSSQQASVLLSAVMPSANSYDPLSPGVAQVQQTAGLAASVAGLFFGNGIGLATGGMALMANLKGSLFPDTEFRSAFAQTSSGGDAMAFCSKNQATKARTRFAYLWAYKVPELKTPSLEVTGASYVPLAAKSAIKLKPGEGFTVKELSHARNWRLVRVEAATPDAKPPAAIPIPVTLGTAANTLELDLTKVKAESGDYTLTAAWDWDTITLGTLHLRPFADFSHIEIPAASRDKLVEGSGEVTIQLTGADFEFVDKAELQAVRRGAPAKTVSFELPKGTREGEQKTISVDLDTAAAGSYKLLLAQADGNEHAVPVTILPPNPKLSNLPVHVNLGEAEQTVKLEGSGIDRIKSVTTDAGTLTGAAQDGVWRGKLALKEDLKAGDKFALALHIKGMDAPLTVDGGILIEAARPKIVSARKALLDDSGLEIRDGELPAGMSVGFVISVERLQNDSGDGRPRLELSCHGGDLRKSLSLSADEPVKGATLSSAGADSLYLALDPGLVGYRGCQLAATVVVAPRGASNPFVLGHVVRLPALEKFTLTGESLGNNQYAGTIVGRDLDLIEKAGWDPQNGLPVVGIPTPVSPTEQSLRVALPWPAPAPHAPLYIWLSGETTGRRTKLTE